MSKSYFFTWFGMYLLKSQRGTSLPIFGDTVCKSLTSVKPFPFLEFFQAFHTVKVFSLTK